MTMWKACLKISWWIAVSAVALGCMLWGYFAVHSRQTSPAILSLRLADCLLLTKRHLTSAAQTRSPKLHTLRPSSLGRVVGRFPPFDADVLPATNSVPGNDWCESTFDFAALAGFRAGRRDYCQQSSSASQLACFLQTAGKDASRDILCTLSGTLKFTGGQGFALHGCSWNASVQPQPHSFASYMYDTGLGNLFKDVAIEQVDVASNCTVIDDTPTLILMRDGEQNAFHFFNELYAFYMTMYTLSLTSHENRQNQILFLDNRDRGPFWDLWTEHFAQRGAKRKADIVAGTCFTNIVWPLPGGSGLFWKGDWVSNACADSQLIRKMAQQVIHSTKMDHVLPPVPHTTVITFISRSKSRLLHHESALFDHLSEVAQSWVPPHHKVIIQRIDFATISFPQQVNTTRHSNILMGVHGAGLTNLMWLPTEAVVIEIMPMRWETGLFRNMAKLLNKEYLSLGSQFKAHQASLAFQDQRVYVKRQDFLDTLHIAVKLTLNHGINMERTYGRGTTA